MQIWAGSRDIPEVMFWLVFEEYKKSSAESELEACQTSVMVHGQGCQLENLDFICMRI